MATCGHFSENDTLGLLLCMGKNFSGYENSGFSVY